MFGMIIDTCPKFKAVQSLPQYMTLIKVKVMDLDFLKFCMSVFTMCCCIAFDGFYSC